MIFPDLGVVVIGRNEGERLAQCLASLEARSGKVVYVDSGSSDGSLETAGRFGALAYALGADRPFNAARARNAGARHLAQAYPNLVFIQFVDGDCVVAPGWLEKAQQFLLADPKAAVVCGRRRERFPGHSVYNRLMDLEWNAPIGAVEACGGDAMMRKVAFESVGGFDESIVAGEEPELCFRLRRQGWTIWRIDAEMTQHDAALRRFSQWWKRSVRSGYGCAQLWSLHKGRVSAALSRQLARTTLWSMLVPLALLLSAAFGEGWLLLLAAYPVQIVRMALRNRMQVSDPWAYAAIMTTSHFAGFQGLCQYGWHAATGRAPGQADYK
jgi:GT2 family glycosyltransferase